MKQSTNNSASFLTPLGGGRGAKKYIKPRIEIIFFDNEISLALESSPPEGPGEGTSMTPKYFHYDPYRNNMG